MTDNTMGLDEAVDIAKSSKFDVEQRLDGTWAICGSKRAMQAVAVIMAEAPKAIAALQAQGEPVADVFCWHSPSMAEVDWEASFTTRIPKDGDWFPLYTRPAPSAAEVEAAAERMKSVCLSGVGEFEPTDAGDFMTQNELRRMARAALGVGS